MALVYHDVPHVVMLATPADLEDYAVGFTLSEGLVARADEIRGVEVSLGEASADVKITVAWERFTQLLQRRRNLTGRTGCGLCGAETAGHNALDKTIGALARAHADFAAGYMLITSRASYEMVQKCATVGISLLVALSAPTAFAVRLAQRTGLTLVAFARADQHVVYAHPQRLTEAHAPT